jgi:hypothetical protein
MSAAAVEMLLEAIDDKVEAWHNGDGEGTELAEFLGMDETEYEFWVHTPSVWARQKIEGI